MAGTPHTLPPCSRGPFLQTVRLHTLPPCCPPGHPHRHRLWVPVCPRLLGGRCGRVQRHAVGPAGQGRAGPGGCLHGCGWLRACVGAGKGSKGRLPRVHVPLLRLLRRSRLCVKWRAASGSPPASPRHALKLRRRAPPPPPRPQLWHPLGRPLRLLPARQQPGAWGGAGGQVGAELMHTHVLPRLPPGELPAKAALLHAAAHWRLPALPHRAATQHCLPALPHRALTPSFAHPNRVRSYWAADCVTPLGSMFWILAVQVGCLACMSIAATVCCRRRRRRRRRRCCCCCCK